MIKDKIIFFLKEAKAYISGEELSKSLAMSRAAVWKYIQELRDEGYDIVAVPHLGYQLASSPDKLLACEIQHGLGTKMLGRKAVHYDSLPSTMDEAFRLGLQGAIEGTVVIAEGQTKGRGRLGRGWFSPKGKGIYMSVVLRPQFNPSEVSKITLLCAVAVLEAIKNVTGLTSLIKWPNDLLIDEKKVAGILTELSAEADRVKFVAVGIGVNVNAKEDSLPPAATSLRSILNKSVSRVELLKEILRRIESHYLDLQTSGFTPVARIWKEFSLTLGKRVRIIDPAGQIEGVAVDIDTDGGLLIRKDSGVIVKKMAGDVAQVR